MPTLHSLSVLIVDSNADTADMLSHLLEYLGHNVHVAMSGRRALALADGLTPDVAILDISLPGMDGYTTALKLCGILPRRPLLIAVTNYPDMDAWSKAEGFDYHFVKPVESSTLFGAIARHESRLAVRG